jgi:hypothetical protein
LLKTRRKSATQLQIETILAQAHTVDRDEPGTGTQTGTVYGYGRLPFARSDFAQDQNRIIRSAGNGQLPNQIFEDYAGVIHHDAQRLSQKSPR